MPEYRFGVGAVVVLSASEALHGLAGLLGGPHTRFVHEVVTTEDAALRLLGRLVRPGERRVQVLAPTEAVRTDLAGRFAELRVQVRPSGNHRAEGHRPGNRPPVVVHHFKWRGGVAEDVERRALHSADGTWQTASPAWLSEARQCMGHLVQHGGRINVDDPRFGFRPVSLRAVPDWWAAEATQLVSAWRPPVYGRAWNESWSMTSSPSTEGGSNRA
ncbi:hypothetical protein [Streptomyces sp. NPDC059906]|uniref:hypothetical protein n=1 Tax=Streptomyces sp. NPDC059906 TaxID=3346997 RepID=UPI0036507A5D